MSDCCWSGCWTLPIHRRDPATAQHGDFCLLRFRPGPVRPSLDNLVASSSPDDTILMPGLARTPDRHRTTPDRDPGLKPSTNIRLQVAGLREHATTPSRQYNFGDLEWWKTLWLWPIYLFIWASCALLPGINLKRTYNWRVVLWHNSVFQRFSWGQPSIYFPIGDHVNVSRCRSLRGLFQHHTLLQVTSQNYC